MNTMQQTWDAADYAHVGRFVADHAGKVMEWLAPQPGERVLDLGCGDGALTEQIAASGAMVVGIDASDSMVLAAQARGLDARVMPAQVMPFQAEFDAVFSNAALHWMHDQPTVLARVRQALKPGGRFVAEMGGQGNIAALRVAVSAVLRQHGIERLDNANVFYTAEEYQGLLETAGFRVDYIELQPRPTLVKQGMRAWLQTFRSGVLEWLPEAERDAALDAMVELLKPVLMDSGGNWWADYVRLRWRAVAVEN
jgi:trans-aconitate methyltransferase